MSFPFRGRISTTLAVALLGLLVSCQAPMEATFSNHNRLQVSLTITNAPVTDVSRSASRVLLPNASSITVTATNSAGTDKQTSSANLATGATSASVSLALINGETYTFAAQAFDASGTVVGTSTKTAIVSAQLSVSLNLLTPSSSWTMVSSWNPTFTPVFPPKGTFTVHLDISDVIAATIDVQPNTTDASYYLQNEDGTALVPKVGVADGNGGTRYTVTTSDLSAGATGFCFTVYNNTNTAQYPGTATFPFTLNPATTNAVVYTLNDSSSPAVIYSNKLTESTGALTTLGSKNLPSTHYTWNAFQAYPSTRSLFVYGTDTLTTNTAIDCYTVNKDGTLTEMPGFPVSASTLIANVQTVSVVAPNGSFYWVTSNSIKSAPLTVSAGIDFSSTNTVASFGTIAPVALFYYASSNYLILATGSSLSQYPLPASGSSTITPIGTTVTPTSPPSAPIVLSPLGGLYYTYGGNTLDSYSLGNTPTIGFYARNNITYTNQYVSLISGLDGQTLYVIQYAASSLTAIPFTISTAQADYGQPAQGTPITFATGSSTTGLSIDPVNKYLLISDGTKIYVLDTTTNNLVTASTTTLSQVSDMAVFRVQ